VFASLAIAAAASASMLTAAAPAWAYPPGNSSNAQISDTTVTPGASVTVSDSGNDPFEQVDVDVHSVQVFVGSTTANGRGVATLTFTVPTSLPAGHHTVVMVGQTSGHTGSVGFTIVRSGSTNPASSGSGLPFTGGNDIWQMTAAGVGLVLVGGIALVVVRRRRHAGLAA
jgi:LPXTG-motif cell wall-anchored protein